MKKLLFALILSGSFQVMMAQQTQPGHPINSVTDQKQNNMSWENSQMSTVTNTDVPTNVNSSFTKKYPNQKDVTWYKTDKGYSAVYSDENKMNQRVMYDMNGNPVYMGSQIKNSALPTSATSYLKQNYPDENLNNVYQVVTPGGEKVYQVWVNGGWMKFDQSGNFMPVK